MPLGNDIDEKGIFNSTKYSFSPTVPADSYSKSYAKSYLCSSLIALRTLTSICDPRGFEPIKILFLPSPYGSKLIPIKSSLNAPRSSLFLNAALTS